MGEGWGAVNIGIAAAGLATASPPEAICAATLGAERAFHDILLLNPGLNVVYAGVALTICNTRDDRQGARRHSA